MSTAETQSHLFEQFAEETELQQALNGWWHYLDTKFAVAPDARRGVTPRLIPDYGVPESQSRTVKFSLVPEVAPELESLSQLVSTKYPHVYVEGTRMPDTYVGFDELYQYGNQPFSTDQRYTLYQQVHEFMTDPRFLLWIYSTNDFDNLEKNIAATDIHELVFLRDHDQLYGFSLQGGFNDIRIRQIEYAYRLPPKIRGLFHHSFPRSLQIEPITREEITIVQDGFSSASQKLQFLNT